MAGEVPFREIVSIAIGGGWGQEAPFPGSIPVAVIRGTDFDRARSAEFSAIPRRHEERRKASRRVLHARDVILEVSGGSPTSGQTTGRSLFATQQIVDGLGSFVIPASFCRLIRFREDLVDPRYAFYALQDMYLTGRAGDYEHQSTGISNFQFEFFLDQETIRLPLLDEQRAIADILGTLDDKIELNRRMNETLEAIARALFKSWFVDFDPVRAKSEGRDPGLPPHLVDLFPDSFVDSELGEIPKGWRVMAIANLAEVNLRTLDRTDRLDVIDYVEISEVTRGQVANVVRYERGSEPSRARRRLVHGDTVLSTVRPDRGSYFLALSPPETLIVSTGFAVASPRDGNWAFLYTALTRPEVGDELGRLADGGAYPAVRPEAVTGLRLVSPQVGEIRTAYDDSARPLYERSERNRIENRLLATVRDTLLPKLISGEVRAHAARGTTVP